VADPEILVLFEDWLEEIEMEVIRLVKTSASDTPESIAERAGLSRAGALFILSKLKKEGKIP
jgi:DNA-binding Lrp family transcriptional regulator